MKQKLQKATAVMVAVLASTGQALAQTAPATPASGLDFSGIIGAIDGSTIVAALTAVASIKILPGVALWGYRQVICWFDPPAPPYNYEADARSAHAEYVAAGGTKDLQSYHKEVTGFDL